MRKTGKNIKSIEELPPAGNHFIFSYIAKRGGREEVRKYLTNHRYNEGENFLVIG